MVCQLAYYVGSNPIPRLCCIPKECQQLAFLQNEALRRFDAAFFACYTSSIPHFCEMGILEMGIFGMGYFVNRNSDRVGAERSDQRRAGKKGKRVRPKLNLI